MEAIASATKFNPELKTLSELANKKYSQEYLSLLVRQGKIHAVKKGKIWYSTKKDIDNYFRQKLRK